MDIKEIIKSQYHSSIRMIKETVENCPDELWNNPDDKNKFWHTAFHALFYTHFYLHVREEDYVPWEKHRDEAVSLTPEDGGTEVMPYTRSEIMEFIDFLKGEIDPMVDKLDLEGESGFHWKPCNKMEFQFEIIRHLQHHTGELADRICKNTDAELNWVGRNY
jgi:hypothetical protein